MINVTKSFLPPYKEYEVLLRKVWKSRHITNNGPLVRELEKKLEDYLEVKHVFVVSNGTIALQVAIRALGLKKEVITTPFSYVATTSSLFWEGCKPIFADIDPDYLTLDAESVGELITESTSGIVATHVYGFPCDVESIEALAKENNIKVLFLDL